MVFTTTDDIFQEFTKFIENEYLHDYEEHFNEQNEWDRHMIYDTFAVIIAEPKNITVDLMLTGIEWIDDNYGEFDYNNNMVACSMYGLMKHLEEEDEKIFDNLFFKFKFNGLHSKIESCEIISNIKFDRITALLNKINEVDDEKEEEEIDEKNKLLIRLMKSMYPNNPPMEVIEITCKTKDDYINELFKIIDADDADTESDTDDDTESDTDDEKKVSSMFELCEITGKKNDDFINTLFKIIDADDAGDDDEKKKNIKILDDMY